MSHLKTCKETDPASRPPSFRRISPLVSGAIVASGITAGGCSALYSILPFLGGGTYAPTTINSRNDRVDKRVHASGGAVVVQGDANGATLIGHQTVINPPSVSSPGAPKAPDTSDPASALEPDSRLILPIVPVFQAPDSEADSNGVKPIWAHNPQTGYPYPSPEYVGQLGSLTNAEIVLHKAVSGACASSANGDVACQHDREILVKFSEQWNLPRIQLSFLVPQNSPKTLTDIRLTIKSADCSTLFDQAIPARGYVVISPKDSPEDAILLMIAGVYKNNLTKETSIALKARKCCSPPRRSPDSEWPNCSW